MPDKANILLIWGDDIGITNMQDAAAGHH